MTLALLFAQAVPVPDAAIAGTAGWAGVGLLGLVLYWLAFHHLPAKDKFIQGLIDAHGKTSETMLAAHTTQQKEDRVLYQAALDKVTSHCEREMQAITSSLVGQLQQATTDVREGRDENRDLHQQTRHNITSLAHTLGLKIATNEIKVRKEPPAGG